MKTVFAKNFQIVENLLWYDGPIIDLCKAGEQDYICFWFDAEWNEERTQIKENIYHVFKTSAELLNQFLEDKVTIRDFMRQADEIYRCVDNFVSDQNEASGELIQFKDIDEEGLPKEGVYFTL